jgi:hypothetical protein
MMTATAVRQLTTARSEASMPATLALHDDAPTTCTACRANGQAGPAIARCRFCSAALCSVHLDAELRALRLKPARACRHVFIASGWLAEALYRRTA